MKYQWENDHKKITIVADDKGDKLAMSTIQSYIDNWETLVVTSNKRVQDAQQKMHEATEELVRSKELLLASERKKKEAGLINFILSILDKIIYRKNYGIKR